MNGPGVFLVSSIFWLRDESLEESDWGRSGRLRSRFKPFNTFKPFKSLKALRLGKWYQSRCSLPRKSSKNLEAALEQFREIAADLSIDESTKENLDGR